MKLAVVLSALVALVTAQQPGWPGPGGPWSPGGPGGAPQQGLPQCGSSTLAQGLATSGCAQNNAQCLCQSQQVKIALLNLRNACPNPTDRIAYQSFYNNMCSGQIGFQQISIV